MTRARHATSRAHALSFLLATLTLSPAAAPIQAQPDAEISADVSAEISAGISAELRALYEADQADRSFSTPPGPDEWTEISRRDRERRARVLELVRADRLRTADDHYHAAMVLQHGKGSEDILLAHILATAAGFLGREDGRWLSAAALDRYLHRLEQPQRFGTQYTKHTADDPWTQEPYESWLPDSLREIFGVRPLTAQRERLEQMNAPR